MPARALLAAAVALFACGGGETRPRTPAPTGYNGGDAAISRAADNAMVSIPAGPCFVGSTPAAKAVYAAPSDTTSQAIVAAQNVTDQVITIEGQQVAPGRSIFVTGTASANQFVMLARTALVAGFPVRVEYTGTSTAGENVIAEIAVIADSPGPVAPCGGCRQKIAEFAGPDVVVTMATTAGATAEVTVRDLLPGAFGAAAMERG